MVLKNVDEGHPEKTEDSSQDFHFYYSRENRLKNAPQSVKDYYDGKMAPKKGLFKVLVSTPANKFLFLSIIVFVAVIWIFTFFNNRNAKSFLGTECELTAFSYEESVYASLKFEEIPEEKLKVLYNCPLTVRFEAYDSSSVLADKCEVTDIYTGKELFIRTKFPDYDIIKIVASVESGTESKEFSTLIQKR